MKTLVSFYSKSGNTKKVGELIAKELKADIDEINDKKKRQGIIRWIMAGRDAFTKKETSIDNKKNPEKYDLLILGTPVWAGTITPAIRTYLQRYKPKKVAFFCTYGGSQAKTFEEMQRLSKKPIAVLGLKDKEINVSKEKIKKFCKELKNKIKG